MVLSKKPTLSHSRVQASRENKTENNLISVLKLKRIRFRGLSDLLKREWKYLG